MKIEVIQNNDIEDINNSKSNIIEYKLCSIIGLFIYLIGICVLGFLVTNIVLIIYLDDYIGKIVNIHKIYWIYIIYIVTGIFITVVYNIYSYCKRKCDNPIRFH